MQYANGASAISSATSPHPCRWRSSATSSEYSRSNGRCSSGGPVSVLVHAEVDGEQLADHEIINEVLLLLIGGDETTRHTLSGGTAQLLRHPEQHQRLVNDLALLPNAIEEMLRWTTPVKNMARTMTADAEVHGTHLEQGEKIILLFESANFDEAVFGDPENFRIDRYPPTHS